MNNYKLCFFIWMLLPLSVLAEGARFVVRGNMKQAPNGTKIYISARFVPYACPKDSAEVMNGSFIYQGEAEAPMELTLTLGGGKANERSPDRLSFYVYDGETNLTISDSLKNAKVEGTQIMQEAREYAELLKYDSTYYENALRYLKERPNSTFNLVTLDGLLMGDVSQEACFNFYRLMPPELQNTHKARSLMRVLEGRKQLASGISADIAAPDINGNDVKLSDFRGKYVLLDFWASWCKPCRKENPNLKKAYANFSNRNFTIVGVSLDLPTDRDKWLKAVAEDSLNWVNISELRGFWGLANRTYQVNGIPTNFLIGPDGHILAKDLRGKELFDVLERFLPE